MRSERPSYSSVVLLAPILSGASFSRRRARPQSHNVSSSCRKTLRRSVKSSDEADENGRKTLGAHERSRRESSRKLTIRLPVTFLNGPANRRPSAVCDVTEGGG